MRHIEQTVFDRVDDKNVVLPVVVQYFLKGAEEWASSKAIHGGDSGPRGRPWLAASWST